MPQIATEPIHVGARNVGQYVELRAHAIVVQYRLSTSSPAANPLIFQSLLLADCMGGVRSFVWYA